MNINKLTMPYQCISRYDLVYVRCVFFPRLDLKILRYWRWPDIAYAEEDLVFAMKINVAKKFPAQDWAGRGGGKICQKSEMVRMLMKVMIQSGEQ